MSVNEDIHRAFTPEQFIGEYFRYKESKTKLTDRSKVQIRHGCDGVTWKVFESDLDAIAVSTCKKVMNGEYYFSPLVEFPVSKNPRITLEEAIQKNEVRILSLSTIRDRIVQGLLYQILVPYSETYFKQLPNVSFAYRPQMSAPDAARRVFDLLHYKKYPYVLDADIVKYFDSIPHDNLESQIRNFFSDEQDIDLLWPLLRRFYSSDRVKADTYQGDFAYFHNHKPIRTNREIGIPQGCVLSGLLANIYLHTFDTWVCNDMWRDKLSSYVRYADDFLIFFHDKKSADESYNRVKLKLNSLGLNLHALGEKSQMHFIDKPIHSINFVGFSIFKTKIRIQSKNIYKYKQRICQLLESKNISGKDPDEAARLLYQQVKFKILGTVLFWPLRCNKCQLPIKQQSWLSFFLSMTDVKQLRELDVWTRQMIARTIFLNLKTRMVMKSIKGPDYPTLEHTYYQMRKKLNDHQTFCFCNRYRTQHHNAVESLDF